MKIADVYRKYYKSIKSNFIFLLMVSSMTRSHALFILSTKPFISKPQRTQNHRVFHLLSCVESACNITCFRHHGQTLKIHTSTYMYVNGFIPSNISAFSSSQIHALNAFFLFYNKTFGIVFSIDESYLCGKF